MAKFVSMMDILKDAEKRPGVVDDCADLVAREVKSKKGFSGTLIKSGYAVVKRLNKGRMIHEVLEGLLDEFVDSLESIHIEYRAEATTPGFDKVLVEKSNEAVQSLLGVTDKRAEKTKHKIILKTYKKLRPKAEEHVKSALPGLGQLIDKHTEC